MTAQGRVSIVMPVRNAGRYLTDCLDSILAQTYQDWELIAVNDHSDDSTQIILDQFSQKDMRIRSEINTGKGIIDALRTAYGMSKGNYITRMDADDLMTSEKLDSMVSLLQNSGPKHIVTGYVEYFSEFEVGEGYQKYAAWLNRLSEAENNFTEIYKECVIASPCWMINREDFESCGAFKSDLYPEDYDLCFRMRNARLQIKSVKNVIHLWRDHSTRASRNDPHYLDNRFLDLKLRHFVNADYDSNEALVLWGAGKKAKKISQYLQNKKIKFRWICNNPKKIGKNIHNVVLESDTVISKMQDAQFIIAVANPKEQKEIRKSLDQVDEPQVYFFC